VKNPFEFGGTVVLLGDPEANREMASSPCTQKRDVVTAKTANMGNTDAGKLSADYLLYLVGGTYLLTVPLPLRGSFRRLRW